ncbi:glycoside hydrolase family 130 protein [Sabulilitoribacter multivorans]|uniref:Glycoside hydrolase family 130 protein n=1 Tax=Flaviramulus multivorans TaxID=1304750 RepID=A0ABS9ILP1_9FLAO|nr:glycoside hydrolase family 130 protein [Flaviramulus multivorans]MCF7561477.1 glycoside hydrolase family 130 protein [Flaviramulus multivorans]
MKLFTTLILAFLLLGCDSKKSTKEVQPENIKSWAFPYFEKIDSLNPILSPTSDLKFLDPITSNMVKWEERNVLNPTAIVKNDKVYLLYRAQDSMGTSRIGMAISDDGLNFKKMPEPIFFPDNDSMKVYEWNYKKGMTDRTNSEDCYFCYFDGVEDPRIVESDSGDYIMTYTSYDGKTARLSIASSKDLISWVKHGLVLKDEKYKDTWSKAGAIVSELQGNKMIAKKIDGKYWMYFGDTNIFMAYSDDLINWDIAENSESKKMISVLHPRMGYFDSRLVEPGPYAMIKDEGILLIYNGSNAENFNDKSLPKFTYAAGQALFDKKSPYKLIDRTEGYFIYPDKDYEKVGEVNEVCFVEGLVYFKNQWFLYYGTADSKIAVAVYDGIKN